MKIKHTINIKHFGLHLFEVITEITDCSLEELFLTIPRWIPGSYKIRDYARFLSRFNTTNSSLETIDPHNWKLNLNNNSVSFSYDFYAFDYSVRGCYLDDEVLLINPCAMIMGIKDHEEIEREVIINLPERISDWKIFTTLKKVSENKFLAKNYDNLIDSPIASGKNTYTIDFFVDSINKKNYPHQLILIGDIPEDIDYSRVASDLKKTCEEEHKVFLDNPLTSDKYLFITLLKDNTYGGLEHEESTVLMSTPESIIKKKENKSEKYTQFLGLCSHEYFHLYNVKRLRPKEFINYDLKKETYTDMLWFFEGITSYYDNLILKRAGIIDEKEYFYVFSKEIERVINSAGNEAMTLKESSKEAWIKLYMPDENSHNTMVSYYTKGALFAYYLDCFIRGKTKGQKSLDTIMKNLWDCYGKNKKGINENIVIREVKGILDKKYHKDIEDVFKTGIHTTTTLNYSLVSKSAGICFLEKIKDETTLGFEVKKEGSKELFVVNKVDVRSICKDSVLSVGDKVVSINGKSYSTKEEWDNTLKGGKVSDVVEVSFLKNKRLIKENHKRVKTLYKKVMISKEVLNN